MPTVCQGFWSQSRLGASRESPKIFTREVGRRPHAYVRAYTKSLVLRCRAIVVSPNIHGSRLSVTSHEERS